MTGRQTETKRERDSEEKKREGARLAGKQAAPGRGGREKGRGGNIYIHTRNTKLSFSKAISPFEGVSAQ